MPAGPRNYVQSVLALAAKALKARAANSRKRMLNPATPKYDFRVFLLSLGLIGDLARRPRRHRPREGQVARQAMQKSGLA